MFVLIDTAIGFIVVILVLGLAIKGITSLFTNMVGSSAWLEKARVLGLLNQLDNDKGGPRQGILPDDRLAQMKIAAKDGNLSMNSLLRQAQARQGRERVPESVVGQVRDSHEQFRDQLETTNKNLALALALTLCLLLNVNCLSIWRSLYADANLRAQFSAPQMVQTVGGGDQARAEQAGTPAKANQDQVQASLALAKQAQEHLDWLGKNVPFAMGKIWTGQVSGFGELLYEFLGSLLSAVLASVGAPYLHDMLRLLTAMRRKTESEGKELAGQTA